MLREISMNDETYEKFLEKLRKKKQIEHEKDLYITDYSVDLNKILRGNQTWITAKQGDIGSNLMDVVLRSSVMLKEKNRIIGDDKNDVSLRKNESIVEYGQQIECKYFLSRAWKNFEYDLERFSKDLYSG